MDVKKDWNVPVSFHGRGKGVGTLEADHIPNTQPAQRCEHDPRHHEGIIGLTRYFVISGFSEAPDCLEMWLHRPKERSPRHVPRLNQRIIRLTLPFFVFPLLLFLSLFVNKIAERFCAKLDDREGGVVEFVQAFGES